MPKWSKHFFSYRKTLRIEIVDLAYSMARNYAIFEICIFQMDTFFSRSFSTMKINREIDEPKQFLRLVAQRHFKHNSVEERHVSVAKNQFESLSIELYAHTHTHVLSHYSIMWGGRFFSRLLSWLETDLPIFSAEEAMHIKYLPQMNTYIRRTLRNRITNTEISLHLLS